MMFSSSGEAVGRNPSWSSRVKNSICRVSGWVENGIGERTNHPRIYSRGVWRWGRI